MKYVIYARKSTESEDRQTLSIQSQIAEMRKVANHADLDVVRIFQESKSAKAPGRPVFTEMMSFIEQGRAEGILCWKIDRLARNPVDAGRIQWNLQNRIIGRIRTHERDYLPEDNSIFASLEFSMASQYSRDLSVNVKRGLGEKIRRGEYPGSAPFGYMRQAKDGKMVPNPNEASWVENTFRRYATGQWSVLRLAKQLTAEGFRSRYGNGISKSAIHRMLSNPLYCGMYRWNGELHKGSHEAIISVDLYEDIQRRLFPERYHDRSTTRFFPFRGTPVCGECGLKMTAEVKKGHTYYRCTKSRGTDRCSQPYIREETFAGLIREELERLRINSGAFELIVEASRQSFASRNDERERRRETLRMEIEAIRRRKESLVEKFIDDLIPKDIYERKQSELVTEEAMLEERLERIGTAKRDLAGYIGIISRFADDLAGIFENGDGHIRKEAIEVVSSNLSIRDRKIATFGLKEAFRLLAKDAASLCAGNDTFEPPKTPRGKGKATLSESLVPVCGEGGIRTRGAVLPAQHISSVPLSTTQPPLLPTDNVRLTTTNHIRATTSTVPRPTTAGIRKQTHGNTVSGGYQAETAPETTGAAYARLAKISLLDRIFRLLFRLFLLLIQLLESESLEPEIDDCRDDQEVNQHAHEIPPHDLRIAHLYRGQLEALCRAEHDADHRIDDIRHQGGDDLGHRTAEEETGRQSDDALLADKLHETADMRIRYLFHYSFAHVFLLKYMTPEIDRIPSNDTLYGPGLSTERISRDVPDTRQKIAVF